MPRTGDRGGADTRARIADSATRLFLQRSFDEVTVADIARDAGVSSVTVFKHFPRKEDLYLDRSAEAEQLLRSAAHDRGARGGAITALHAMSLRLLETRHPLSGLDDRSAPFFRTVAGSPALIARALEIAAELQRILAEELAGDPTVDGSLVAALVVAGYGAALVSTARRRIEGATPEEVEAEHRATIGRLFAILGTGA